MKQLKTILKELKKRGFKDNIYIGGEYGSGYFYIGSIENTEEMLNNYITADTYTRMVYERLLDNFDRMLCLKSVSGWKMIDKFSHVDDLVRTRTKIAHHKEYISHFHQDILNCDVRTTYPKEDISEPGLVIILAYGCQIGKLWLANEAEEKREKEEVSKNE